MKTLRVDEEVAKKLRKLRAEHKFSQREVANHLGISQQTYSKYESRETGIDSQIIVKLCLMYNISSDYLLGLSVTKDGEPAISESSTDIDLIVNKVIEKLAKKELDR